MEALIHIPDVRKIESENTAVALLNSLVPSSFQIQHDYVVPYTHFIAIPILLTCSRSTVPF